MKLLALAALPVAVRSHPKRAKLSMGNLGLFDSVISGPGPHKSTYRRGNQLTKCFIRFDVFAHTPRLQHLQ